MKALSWKHVALTLGAFFIILAAIQASGIAGGDLAASLGRVLGTGAGWRSILARSTPLLITGLAVYVALRAGLFNIGAEGQMLMGGLAAAAVFLALPSPVGLLLGIAAGAVAGALWSWPAGWIKACRGGHEVISTIMLNWIARFFSAWVVKGPLADPTDASGTTARIAEAVRLPNLIEAGPFRMNLAFLLALALVAGVAIWLTRTVSGYEMEAVGANPKAAEAAGMPVARTTILAMAVSGALSGLAGAFLVAGSEHRFYPDLAGGAGFDGLGVALLAAGSPWFVLPSATFFGLVDVATSGLSLAGLPKGISGLLLGLVILVFASYRFQRRKG